MLYALLGRLTWFVAKRLLRRRAAALGPRIAAAVAVLALVGALAAAGLRRRG